MQAPHPLTNLTPIDGRYAQKVTSLQDIVSEYGLIKHRVEVEIVWFLALCAHPDVVECPPLSQVAIEEAKSVYTDLSVDDAKIIKEIEATTNHDVKAVEYFIKQRFEANEELKQRSEFVHFACTSEDINNLAYALMVQKAHQILDAQVTQVSSQLSKLAHETKTMAMLSLTHGQTASPTTLGKEIANVLARVQRQQQALNGFTMTGKINGAVGNFNAHIIAYPDVDWRTISQTMIESLGLEYNPMTTQIEPHDALSEWLDGWARLNTILIDFSADVWGYVSRGIFGQTLKEGEVGSSTMPHKVNPIDFENAEGNLGVANALATHMARKLPRSRFQRDLTDSTVLRNLGTFAGFTLIALTALDKGLCKLKPNDKVISAELDQAWEVLAEPIQTVMRKHGIEQPYEKLKAFTRGQQLDEEKIRAFIQSLDLENAAKESLLRLTPSLYTGLASSLVENLVNDR